VATSHEKNAVRLGISAYLRSMGRGKNRRGCNAAPVVSPDTGTTDDAVPYDAIHAIVDYLWEDECEDYESFLGAGEDIDGHIFQSLKAVSKWLSRIGK
jgi:hypothetical protein